MSEKPKVGEPRKCARDWVDDDVEQLVASTCNWLGNVRRTWLIVRAAAVMTYVESLSLLDKYVDFFSGDLSGERADADDDPPANQVN